MILVYTLPDSAFSQKMFVWRTIGNRFHVTIIILVCSHMKCNFENRSVDKVLMAKMNFE